MQKTLIFLVFSIMLFADSSLSKAFLNANVEGEIKSIYYSIEKDSDPNAYATALGGYLKYSTDTNNSIFGSIRFHSSNKVGSNLNSLKTNLFNNDNNANSFSVNSELFIAYKTKKRIMKLGNLMLKTPMINDDTSRIVPWSYQGFAYTGDVTKNMRVQVYYISQIRSYTSGKYEKISASGEIGDSGITMLSFHYEGINKLVLDTYYYYAPELYSTFIAKADYKHYVNADILVCSGVEYFNSGDGGKYAQSENKNGGDDIDLVALQVSADTNDVLVSLGYSQNFGVSGILKGYGGGTKLYTSSMIVNGRGNYKPETWMLKGRYNLPISSTDSEVAFTLTNTNHHDSRGDDFNAYYLHFKHFFNADSYIHVRYENINYTGEKSDADYFRLIGAYRF